MITKEQLDTLRSEASSAKSAFLKFRTPETVEGDLENKRLLDAASVTGAAYDRAIDQYIKENANADTPTTETP